jgi:hypothetical protein
MAMADGDATETAAAIVDGNRNGKLPMATVMGGSNGDGNGVSDGDGDGDGNGNGDGHGKGDHCKGRVASSCAGNVQPCGRGNTLPPTPCLHPHGHKGKCIHQRCVMVVTLQKVFAPFQGGGFLTAHHRFFFIYYLQLLFSLLNNPLFAPRIIQALKNPVSPLTPYLLFSSKNPISLLRIYPGSYCTFCQGKSGQGMQ